MGTMIRNIDLMKGMTKNAPPNYRIQVPKNYSVPLAVAQLTVPLTLTREAIYVKSFTVQADLANTDWIRVGDQGINAVNGIQLDPGWSKTFEIDEADVKSALKGTQPASFAVRTVTSREMELEFYLNIADFFAWPNAADQRVTIIYGGHLS